MGQNRLPQTNGLAPQSGAETGLFSHQGPVVNTKMEPCCPPRKLSLRFVAKTQNRSNCGALFFPFSGVLEGVFLKSIFVSSGTQSGPRRLLWARIRIGGVQENLGLLIHSEMSEVPGLRISCFRQLLYWWSKVQSSRLKWLNEWNSLRAISSW